MTDTLFSLSGRAALVTGGTGALGGAIARGLARAGASVMVLGRRAEAGATVVDAITAAGGTARFQPCDVTDEASLTAAREAALTAFGRIDVLVNAAGGNMPNATLPDLDSFFGMSAEGFRDVIDLNLTGTVLPVRVLAEPMAKTGAGSIINISSMAATRPMTRVLGYAAAKAGIDNMTKWLAVHFARNGVPGLRVNAISPGFFLGDQNRAMLVGADGTPTPRGQSVIDATPMARFGEPDELIGTAVWLASDASRFVTGISVPVDGGFSAYAGV